jgi:putative peptide zinc metalloprotease protein
MSMDDPASRTFSDSWHRVAKVRVELRSSVRAHRQTFRGDTWVMLRDTLSSDWFRVSGEAWAFVSRLSLERTIEDAWMLTLEADPDTALTQEEVVQLLGQLNLSNLLNFDRSSAGASLFERYAKRRRQETKALLMGFLAIKIPILDPDRMLAAAMPLIRVLFGPIGAVLYLVLLAVAGKALIDSADSLFSQSAGLLAPGNLPLLYVGFIIAKVVHEFGHAAVCKRYGGEVHKMGVMLLIFAPMPYVDATSSWGFRSRGERLLTGAAGVIAELGVAAVAALLWAHTAPGAVNAIAYNVIFVASVSSLLFNLNPLLRFDGYHMLVDFLDVPNLFQRSREQLRYLGERFLLALPNGKPAARTLTEAWLLPLYGVTSIVYWLMLMATIVFFIAGEYLDLGVALAWILGFTVVVVPLWKFLKFLTTSPRLHHYRARTVALAMLVAAVVILPLSLVPMPDRIRASGVLEASVYRQLNSDSPGFLVELMALPGASVRRGEPLMRLESPELLFDLRAALLQREQLLAQELRATSLSVADLMPLRHQREAVESVIAELERQRAALLVTSPIDGIWSAPDLDTGLGRWVARGAPLGAIVDPGSWRFVAVLPQVATHLFDNRVHQVELRLRGQEHLNIVAPEAKIVPFETGTLPSRALGFAGGGDIAVSASDQNGLTAAEPFFRIQAMLPIESLGDGLGLAHGRLGTIRLTLDDAPLLLQWERGVRQFLQRRFRV